MGSRLQKLLKLLESEWQGSWAVTVVLCCCCAAVPVLVALL